MSKKKARAEVKTEGKNDESISKNLDNAFLPTEE